MKITNNLGLPEPFVRAVEAGEKKERVADYSVTEVIKPPRMLQLERRHKAEMVADASSRVWLLIGKAIHSVLEMAGVKVAGELVEKTMVLTVELGSGAKRTVSGTPDNHTIIDGTLSDWKVTSVWSFLKDKPEWVAQLNLYKYMLEIVEKLEVQRIQIVAILRDWSVTRSYEKNYPECAVAVLPLEIWTKGQTGSYLGERLELHVAAETVPDSALPQCSPQERWEKPPTYAVKKPEAKSAYRNFRVADAGEAPDPEARVFATKEEAEAAAASFIATQKKPSDYISEFRPGESTRCRYYCSALPWCNQGKFLVPETKQAEVVHG